MMILLLIQAIYLQTLIYEGDNDDFESPSSHDAYSRLYINKALEDENFKGLNVEFGNKLEHFYKNMRITMLHLILLLLLMSPLLIEVVNQRRHPITGLRMDGL